MTKLSFDYDEIADIYDELMQFIPYDEWAKYIMNLYYQHGGNGSRFIDLGGGTGNVALKLTRYGFSAILVDRSFEMIREAQRKIRSESVYPVCADITRFCSRKSFDLAICMYDTVNHLTEKEFLSFLLNAYNLLSENGILMFDFNTDFGLRSFAEHTQVRNGASFSSSWKTDYDEKTQVCTLNLSLKRGRDEYDIIFQERSLPFEEIEFCIENSGFRKKNMYHFLEYYGLKKTSERGMVVCQK